MKNNPEIELLNSISFIHRQLYAFYNELKQKYPQESLGFDLSMYSTNREEWPDAPIGITWEINLDIREEVFLFELLHESTWMISAELAKYGMETIRTYFLIEHESFYEIKNRTPDLIDQFKTLCSEHLNK